MSPPNASLFLIMVCFWVTFWLVQRFLIRPIWGVLTERRQQIDGAQRTWAAKNEEYLSATSRAEAEIDQASRETARVRGDARQKAMAERQRRLAEARAAADQRLQSALQQLSAEADASRAELAPQAMVLARRLAGRLIGREVRT